MGFRRKLPKAEQEARDKMLAEARRSATSELRGGRSFRVLRLPDRYGESGPAGGKLDRESALDSLPEAE